MMPDLLNFLQACLLGQVKLLKIHSILECTLQGGHNVIPVLSRPHLGASVLAPSGLPNPWVPSDLINDGPIDLIPLSIFVNVILSIVFHRRRVGHGSGAALLAALYPVDLPPVSKVDFLRAGGSPAKSMDHNWPFVVCVNHLRKAFTGQRSMASWVIEVT